MMICGDFNMTPDSALYHYMVRGSLAADGLNRRVPVRFRAFEKRSSRSE